MPSKKIIAFSLFIFLCGTIFSQVAGKIKLDYFEKAHQYGIPAVYDMFQDNTGLIWLGSTNGVYRYNGHDILEFSGEEKKFLGKTNYSFLQEKNGDVLIGSDYGLCRYKLKENKIELLVHLERPFDERSKYCIIGYDQQNYLWLSISGVGIARYKQKLEFIPDPQNNKGPKPDRLKQAFVDLKNNKAYLCNHRSSPAVIDLSTQHITALPLPYVSSIQQIDERIFFIYPEKIITRDLKTNHETSYFFPEEAVKKMGALYGKTCIYDKSHLWISGMYGILPFNLKQNTFEDYFGVKKDSKSSYINLTSELFSDCFGNVWICSETDGIRILNTFRQKRFQHTDGSTAEPMTVMDVESVNDSLLLVCPLVKKPCLINLKKNTSISLFPDLVKDGETYKIDKINDSICVISNLKKAYLFNYSSLRLSKLSCSEKDLSFFKLLVTKPNAGYLLSANIIYKFEFIKGSLQLSKGTRVESAFNFTLLHDDFNHVVIFSTSENSTILKDSSLQIEKIKKPILGAFNAYQRSGNGNLWLATRQGLKHYDHRYHLVETFNTDNGLNNDVIYELRFNRDSSMLFLSTNRGISSIDIKTKKILNYSMQDGVQESEHNTGASTIGKDGTFYFGNISGVTFFKEENLKRSAYKPLIFVTNILVNDSDYTKVRLPQFIDTIVLQPGTNNFSLRYRVFQNAEPEKIIYSYKLEGGDRNWEKNNSSPTINYTGLEPGIYSLKLRGRVENQSAEKIIIIRVLSPFYKTWWFRLISFFIAILIIFILSSLIAKARVRRKEKKLEMERRLLEQKTQISRDLHDNVGARLSMMLNTMDWITKAKTLDPDVITELQDNTRSVIQNLRETIWVMNKEEITVVELFDKIKTYALQFFKHHGTQVHFDERITNDKAIHSEQTLNLFRITQEVLNNILKYANASLVHIGVHYHLENSLEINFKDNGVGFDLTNYVAGNGILNMKERADEINAELHIDSHPGKGTFIRIRLYSK